MAELHEAARAVRNGFDPFHLGVACFFFIVLGHLVRNYFKLRHIPGPVLAGSTRLWRMYYQHRGLLRDKLVALHEKHGPLVRYAPDCVSIRDSSVIQPIYSGVAAGGRVGSFNIGDSYKVLLGIDPVTKKDVQSLVCSEDGYHAKLRRAIAGPFSQNSVVEMEPIIESTIVELRETMERVAMQGREADLAQMMLWYSLDNATMTLFGEPGGCLRSDTDVQGLGDMIRSRFEHWGYWSSLPDLERLLLRNPISLKLKNSKPADFARKAAARITERMAKPWLAKDPDLLNRLIDTREKYPDVMDVKGTMGIVMSTISGAADTTASTLTAIFYDLMTHPTALKKLREEIAAANLSSPVPKNSEVKSLPYLDAVIKESMRIFTLLNWPMERIVPEGGATLAGLYYPAGTHVGVFPAAIHMDKSVFGEDVATFRPERWLSGDVDKTKRMEASFLGFSRGKRVCLGQHLALLQMKKIVPMVVESFDMALAKPGQTLDAEYTGAIAVMEPLPVRLRTRT